jgi:hypothetical protein
LPQRLVLVLPMRIHSISIWWMNLGHPGVCRSHPATGGAYARGNSLPQ